MTIIRLAKNAKLKISLLLFPLLQLRIPHIFFKTNSFVETLQSVSLTKQSNFKLGNLVKCDKELSGKQDDMSTNLTLHSFFCKKFFKIVAVTLLLLVNRFPLRTFFIIGT